MIPRFYFIFTLRNFLAALNAVFHETYDTPEDVKNYFEGQSLFFVSKARIGIRLCLDALGLEPGSGIGVQPFTCSSVLYAIKKAGHRPVFIDMNENYQLSRTDLSVKSAMISAILVTHIFGFPEDVQEIQQLVKKPVIEDCAQALFSESNDKPLGMTGKAGVYSTGFGKMTALGDGGFIITSDPGMKESLEKLLSDLPEPGKLSLIIKSFKSLLLGFLYNPLIYTFFTFPFKKMLIIMKENDQSYPEKEYASGNVVRRLFSLRFRQNREKANRQMENGRLLKSLTAKKLTPPMIKAYNRPNFFLLPVRSTKRDMLISYLKSEGIEGAKHFSRSVQWAEEFGYVHGSCPLFEKIAAEIVTIPCHYYLSEKQIRNIAGTLNHFV